MSKWFYLCIIFSIYGQTGLTKIPDAILEYLDRNKDYINDEVNYRFNAQERDLIVQRMAEKLMTRSPTSRESSGQTEKEIIAELVQYLKSKIVNRDVSKTKEKPREESQSEKKSHTANKEVAEKIFKTFPGTFDGKILRINYKGAVLPLKVKTSEKGILITLSGLPLSLPSTSATFKQCLYLKFLNKSPTYTIEWLGSLETVCPLPVEKEQGAYLLKLAEDLARALEKPHLSLNDTSEVLCVKDLEKASLRLLRVWEKKKSWYESKDYTPATPEIGQLLEKESMQLNALRLEDFQTALHEINATTKPIFIEKLQEFRKEAPQKNSPFFADFMAWLWPHDCAAYNAVFKLLKSYNYKLDDEILIDDDIWLQKKL